MDGTFEPYTRNIIRGLVLSEDPKRLEHDAADGCWCISVYSQRQTPPSPTIFERLLQCDVLRVTGFREDKHLILSRNPPLLKAGCIPTCCLKKWPQPRCRKSPQRPIFNIYAFPIHVFMIEYPRTPRGASAKACTRGSRLSAPRTPVRTPPSQRRGCMLQ